MDDQESVIEQHPFSAAATFTVRDAAAGAMQTLFDRVADGLHLRRATAGAEQKVVREGSRAAQIQHGNIQSLFVLGRFHG